MARVVKPTVTRLQKKKKQRLLKRTARGGASGSAAGGVSVAFEKLADRSMVTEGEMKSLRKRRN